MCQFGNADKIIETLQIDRKDALIGYRNWILNNAFNNKEKHLKATNREINWPKREVCSGLNTVDNSAGIYSYNSYNNYNYYYYYNNYNYNYKYNYINYYNNYNYNYNYYNYYNYNIVGRCLNFGKIFKYKEGYRAQFSIPFDLVIISKPNIIHEKFIANFNKSVMSIALEYGIKCITQEEFEKEK